MFSPLNIRIGFYLALRALRRASLWTTGLIVFVMVLTFLNLVVISGILVGLLQGAVDAVRTRYTSDVIISTLSDKKYIENSPNLIELARNLEGVEALTPRYRESASLEANYRTRKESDKANIAPAQIIGIDPASEDEVTGLSEDLIEGEFLVPGDYDKIVLGNYLLKQYMVIETPGLATLENVGIGTKIRIHVGDVTREVEVKGILKSKVDEIALRAFMVDSQFRSMIGRNDGNVDEISIKVEEDVDPAEVRDALLLRGAGNDARVQTYEDAQPQAFKDIIATFSMLGTMFSSIGLVVASVTIFIVIFINAITRRKYIGILKGIGIHGKVIELSYVFQSIFYAVLGSAVGLALVYGFLVPYFANNPIDFPFSDGILVAPINQTFFRVGLLIVSTVIAGYIPAWMIVRRNTLDSILGRN
ncbi:MAG: ABC transporter permease [Candidatus Kaiserbacteria bacterium]|nr:MAG: ABC transporter permease [Candidatus Kaiserbacteria bacterium]